MQSETPQIGTTTANKLSFVLNDKLIRLRRSIIKSFTKCWRRNLNFKATSKQIGRRYIWIEEPPRTISNILYSLGCFRCLINGLGPVYVHRLHSWRTRSSLSALLEIILNRIFPLSCIELLFKLLKHSLTAFLIDANNFRKCAFNWRSETRQDYSFNVCLATQHRCSIPLTHSQSDFFLRAVYLFKLLSITPCQTFIILILAKWYTGSFLFLQPFDVQTVHRILLINSSRWRGNWFISFRFGRSIPLLSCTRTCSNRMLHFIRIGH